jgi:hypothetical protein
MTIDISNSPSETVLAARVRAKRICDLADQDLLHHPPDGFVHSPLLAIYTYQHIRFFCGGFAGFHNYSAANNLNREEATTSTLILLQELYSAGAKQQAEMQSLEISDVTSLMATADLVESGLQSRYKRSDFPQGYEALFFVLALDELVDFVDFFENSYKTKQELRKTANRESSYKSTIDALGSLISAQVALELGMRHMIEVVGASRFNELNRKLHEEQKRKSEAGRKAADAKHNKPGGSRDLGEKIRGIWASGKYKSRDICAEEEWRGLGYGSIKAARNALINTPRPPQKV